MLFPPRIDVICVCKGSKMHAPSTNIIKTVYYGLPEWVRQSQLIDYATIYHLLQRD